MLVIPLLCTRLGLLRCASCWTRPVGGGLWGHYLCYPWVVCWAAQKTACQKYVWISTFHGFKPEMPALVGPPSLHSFDAFLVYWVQGASRRDCRQQQSETSFSLKKISGTVLILWFLSIGRAKHLGPGPPCHPAVEVFNVGDWLTHGDLALEAHVDFLAVAVHRLVPARVRSEWSRFKSKGVASIWAPASQDSSHVLNAGVGVVSMRGGAVSLPSFATASSSGSLIVVGRSGVCCRCVLVGSCIW